ncbi:MAG TPA: protein kinase [Herpetosiphonaceae bacterium]
MIPRSIGNYNLERELDRGGVAAVFLARHRTLNRQVAIKLLLNQAEDQIERFKREAELTSQLDHPHIVEIYDHGMHGPYAYTVMEAAMGGSLRQKLEKAPGNKLGLEDALRIFRQIGEALDYAHSKGTIHRDVTPGNILLDAGGARALLTDFGIARSEKRQGLTATRMIMGTPGFFSPEHLRSAKEVTAQSDVFALGLVLYTMLSGRMPWDNIPDNPTDLFSPPKPLSQTASLQPGIDPIMMTLLAVDPKHRYATVQESIEELRRIFPAQAVLRDAEAPQAVTRAFYVAHDFQAIGIEENEVERVLGPHLDRQVIGRANRRAEALRQPDILVDVLDEWSRDERFRLQNIGRLATFHAVSSQNVYFYELDVLLETRHEPYVWEQPDRARQPMSGTREVTKWEMKVPPPAAFEEASGTVNELTGSDQVSHCSKCSGKGNVLCDTCKGNGRITVTRTVERPVDVQDGQGHKTQASVTSVENTVKPCPECAGKGFLRCPTCEGIGMVIRRKGFKWERKPIKLAARDDAPGVDETALEPEALEVYNQTTKEIPEDWRGIHAIAPLLQRVEDQLDAHTKVTMARLVIQMVPVTRVEFELGARPNLHPSVVTIDGDSDPDAAQVTRQLDTGAERRVLHLLGFANAVSQREAALFRDWSRLLLLGGLGFSVVLLVLTVIVVLLIY